MNDVNLVWRVHTFIEKNELIKEGDKIIVALSGGPDSVFLLHVLNEYRHKKNITLIAAHLDHEWRATSSRDAMFCEQLCKKLRIIYTSTKSSDLCYQPRYNGSKEELGRNLRRFFLQKQLVAHNAHSIALGHHANDQEENFFIRLTRGTSLSGLVGMKNQDGNYIRPLLSVHKNDIINYLKQNNIDYITDETNASCHFLRNQIRHEVIGKLHIIDTRFEKNFSRSLEKLQQAEQFLDELSKKYLQKITEVENKIYYLNLDLLQKIDQFLQQRIILLWIIAHKVPFTPTEKFIKEIYRFFYQSSQKKHIINRHWQLNKKNAMAFISLEKN